MADPREPSQILSLLREGSRRINEERDKKPPIVTGVEGQAIATLVAMTESAVAAIPVQAVHVTVPATDGSSASSSSKPAMLNKVQFFLATITYPTEYPSHHTKTRRPLLSPTAPLEKTRACAHAQRAVSIPGDSPRW